MYPELITRPDIKVFLPPIGNLTVYICKTAQLPSPIDLTFHLVGPPQYMYDESKELTLRVHDECTFAHLRIKPSLIVFTGNGSDVFGSDICTCKPYLVYAIEECIRCAQRGGVGVVVYFRKEGRALGEVTKLVLNLDIVAVADMEA
jgi:hypothetical protein